MGEKTVMLVRMLNYYTACGKFIGSFMVASSKIVGGSCIRYRVINPFVALCFERRKEGRKER